MQLNTLLSPLIKAFLHTEYCYCQYYSIDITLDILGLDILGLDILGLDILGLDILGYTPYIHVDAKPFVLVRHRSFSWWQNSATRFILLLTWLQGVAVMYEYDCLLFLSSNTTMKLI